MVDRRPGEGRYAHPEREQRWIASEVPAGSTPVASIVDRYIVGTRLRLRRSESEDGVVYKLGQKVRRDPADPTTVSLTTMYLSEEEHAALLVLPAAELRKTRRRAQWHGRDVGIDRFSGHLEGLLLAEVELGPDEPLLPPPRWATRDVTYDNRYSGGALAVADDEAIRTLLT